MKLIKEHRFTFFSWITLSLFGTGMMIYWSLSIENKYNMYFSFFNVIMYLFAFTMGYVAKKSFDDLKNESNKSDN